MFNKNQAKSNLNVWLTNFPLFFETNVRGVSLNISFKKQWKTSQSKIMHCPYLRFPLINKLKDWKWLYLKSKSVQAWIDFACLKIDWQIHVYQVAHCAPVVVRSGKEGCVITAPHTWTHHRVWLRYPLTPNNFQAKIDQHFVFVATPAQLVIM